MLEPPSGTCSLDHPRRVSNNGSIGSGLHGMQIWHGVGEGDGTTNALPLPHLLLVDPKPLTRGCLFAGLSGAPGIASISAVSAVEELQPLASSRVSFDAAIVNLGAEWFDDAILAETIAPVRTALPDAAMLLLTSRIEPVCLAAALHRGVRGYLTTDLSLDNTLAAIRLVCAGCIIYPGSSLILMTDRQSLAVDRTASRGDTRIEAAKLTPRQNEVLQCLAMGMPNKGIAFHLNMSESTVKAHIQGIMRRVGAVNRTQVVALLGAESA